MRDETPTHHREMPNFLSVFAAHGQDGLCRRDVVAGMIVNFAGRMESLSQIAFGVGQSVAVTHLLIVADSRTRGRRRASAWVAPDLESPKEPEITSWNINAWRGSKTWTLTG